jgi:hypothetical protein
MQPAKTIFFFRPLNATTTATAAAAKLLNIININKE